jgi:hypothetical protein
VAAADAVEAAKEVDRERRKRRQLCGDALYTSLLASIPISADDPRAGHRGLRALRAMTDEAQTSLAAAVRCEDELREGGDRPDLARRRALYTRLVYGQLKDAPALDEIGLAELEKGRVAAIDGFMERDKRRAHAYLLWSPPLYPFVSFLSRCCSPFPLCIFLSYSGSMKR